MTYTNELNSNIMHIIKMFSSKFYHVGKKKGTVCTCVSHETSQPNPDCPKCLGTGNNIVIREIVGAAQETNLPTTFRNDKFIVAKNYYIKTKYKIEENDLIIDRGVIYNVFEIKEAFSLEGTNPYNKVVAIKKKFDSDKVIENFNNIIKR